MPHLTTTTEAPPPTTTKSRLATRLAVLRTRPDRGSHAVEYAIGIGLGAAAILAVFVAYKLGLADVMKSWVFS
jgi:hypothetical protein